MKLNSNKKNVKQIYFEQISYTTKKEQLVLEGPLGNIAKCIKGQDILELKKKKGNFFFFTKNSYYNFLSYLKQSQIGLTNGYYFELDFIGLGYRFIQIEDGFLLKLGFGHYIKLPKFKEIHMFGYKKKLILFSINLQKLGLIVNEILTFKQLDAYKGKGICITGTYKKLKIGKRK